MKIYLAGRMRHVPHLNCVAFIISAAVLRRLGHVVWSPAEEDIRSLGYKPGELSIDEVIRVMDEGQEELAGRGIAHFMSLDLPQVCEADAVVVIPGWETSQGVACELYTALTCGHRIYETPRIDVVDPELHDITDYAKRAVGFKD